MEFDVSSYYLIALVEKRPVLWNKNLEDHRIKFITLSAWREVCGRLNKNYEKMGEVEQRKFCKFVGQKWRNIRNGWTKWNKKRRAGNNKKYLKRYIYDAQLQFLRKTTDNSEVSNNSDSATTDDDTAKIPESTEKPSTSSAAKGSSCLKTYKKHNTDDVDKSPTMTIQQIEERHISFIRGVLPSLHKFNETQVLKFQMGVLKLIKSIQNYVPEGKMLDPSKQDMRNIYEKEADYRCYKSRILKGDNQPNTSSITSKGEINLETSPTSSLSDVSVD